MPDFAPFQMQMPRHCYIHIPYCLKKCPYCDFNSYPLSTAAYPPRDYERLLLREIERGLDLAKASGLTPEPLETLYFGGGTPTAADISLFEAVIRLLKRRLGFVPGAELSLEMNPALSDAKKLKALRALGINRLSIGLQTSDDTMLRRIGRIHTKADFCEAYRRAREAGFSNINVDLMLALPGQKALDLERDLDFLLSPEISPEHISVYSLIVEEGTPFAERYTPGEPPLPSDESERAMYHRVRERLREASYIPYEISNHAKAGFESRHNTAYWDGKSYFGFGAGASSYVLGERKSNPPALEAYREMVSEALILPPDEIVDREEAVREFFIFRLRKAEGFSEEEFKTLFGRPFSPEERAVLAHFRSEGLLCFEGERWFYSDQGLDFSDEVARAFI